MPPPAVLSEEDKQRKADEDKQLKATHASTVAEVKRLRDLLEAHKKVRGPSKKGPAKPENFDPVWNSLNKQLAAAMEEQKLAYNRSIPIAELRGKEHRFCSELVERLGVKTNETYLGSG